MDSIENIPRLPVRRRFVVCVPEVWYRSDLYEGAHRAYRSEQANQLHVRRVDPVSDGNFPEFHGSYLSVPGEIPIERGARSDKDETPRFSEGKMESVRAL